MTDSPDEKSRNCLPDNKQHNNEEVGCPWFINSPEHSNCFWIYVHDRSAIDGSMPELVQSEIAALLGWANTKTHFALKQAMVELTEALKQSKAHQLLINDSDESLDVNTFYADPITNYTSDPTEE